jgi:hypothetical protein
MYSFDEVTHTWANEITAGFSASALENTLQGKGGLDVSGVLFVAEC